MAPKRLKFCCADGMLSNLAFLNLNHDICVLIVYICVCSANINGFHIRAGYCCRSGLWFSKYLSNSCKSIHVIKGTKCIGQISQVIRKLNPWRVLNAGGCDAAEAWVILHSKQKRDLSPLPKTTNELQKGTGFRIVSPFFSYSYVWIQWLRARPHAWLTVWTKIWRD